VSCAANSVDSSGEIRSFIFATTGQNSGSLRSTSIARRRHRRRAAAPHV